MFFQKSPVLFPPALEKALISAFWDEKPSVQSSTLKKLWVELAPKRGQETIKEESGSKKPPRKYSMTKEMVEVYGAYYLPVNFMKLPLIIKESKLLGKGQISPSLRWLDFGCGPGTALWGLVAAAIENSKTNITLDYIGVDESKNFSTLAQAATQNLKHTLTKEGFDCSGLKTFWEVSKPNLKEYIALIEKHHPDVICFMNSLGEFFSTLKEKELFLEELKKYCAHKKKNIQVLVIEPGTKAASRELLEWRETFRVNTGGAGSQVRIALPCLDNRACGALAEKSEWCHEESEINFPDWFQNFGKQAGLVKESLLYSYLLFEVGRFSASDPIHTPATNQSSLNLKNCRMVSQRMEPKGMTQCFLCAEQGRFKARVLNAREDEKNKPFVNAVRGEIWKEVELSLKGDVLGLS